MNNASVAQSDGGVVLRLHEVTKRLGLGRSTIYDFLRPDGPRHDSDFPKSFPLGVRARGWLAAEVDEWVQNKAAKRGSKEKAK